MAMMNSETRVGIDGRRYARKQQKQYIDVLHLPSISDAVNLASKMLRVGIINAMSSNSEVPREAVEPRPKAKSDRNSKQTTVARGRAKPHDVYSALAEKSNKLTKEKAAALREVLEVTPATASKESSLETSSSSKSDLKSGSRLIARSWNSASKAGPSILSKRPRGEETKSNFSSSSHERAVLQPEQKRERRNEDDESDGTEDGEDVPVKSKSKHANKETNITSKDRESLDPRRNSEAKHNLKKAGSSSGNGGSEKWSLGPGKVIKKADHLQANSVPSMASKMSSLANRESMQANRVVSTSAAGVLPSRQTATVIASGMRPKSSTSVVPARKTMTVIASGMRPKPMSTIANRITTASMKSSTLPAVPKFTPRSIGAVSAYRSVTPETRYIKELNSIGNIPANGYQETAPGKVHPVVTFDPRPKVPHKLRQTTIEKIFEAWRDVKQLPQMEALVKALRTEQQMYASAAGRMDYRAAAIVTLQMARDQ